MSNDVPMGSQTREPGLRHMLRDDIDCVFQRDPAARTRIEVMTTYPGVHAIMLYRLAHRLWRRGLRYLPRLLSYIARIWTGIDIHPGASIGRRFFIDHGAGVVIGETAEIGDNVTLYHGVTLGGVSWNKGKRHPTLGDNVVVGAGAKILGPIEVGRDARVGANSVVISAVPEGKTVVGIPGKVVRSRTVAEQQRSDGIDLNHHLMPDPVTEAVSCLLDRIRQLEQVVGVHGCLPGGETAEDECRECDAVQVCEPVEIEFDRTGTDRFRPIHAAWGSNKSVIEGMKMSESELDLDLDELSSAEDFLEYFGVPYEASVVHVNRLHILQRFHDYLDRLGEMPEAEVAQHALYRECLTRAYLDFVDSDALTEKVFKVFRMNEPVNVEIPLSDLLPSG